MSEAAQAVKKTIGDVLQKIVKLSREDDSSLPVARGFAWFGMYDQDGKLGPPITFKIFDKSPFNPRMGIVAMFQNETEVRVYSLPIEKPAKDEIAMPARHTLSKTAPTFFFESLPQEIFELEVATELSALAENTATAEDFEDDPNDPIDDDEDEPEHGEIKPPDTDASGKMQTLPEMGGV